MEFTLYYRGSLKTATGSKKRRDEKHSLRKVFHQQLKVLWQQTPLNEHQEFLEPNPEGELSLLREVGKFQFVPTINTELHMVADLVITLLRPEPPGQIVTQSGDIDNRLKTLLDALKVPSQPDDLPRKVAPSEDENPFFCLLEDDNLITSLDIKTDRLLDPLAKPTEVVLLLHVRTRLLRATWGNIGLV